MDNSTKNTKKYITFYLSFYRLFAGEESAECLQVVREFGLSKRSYFFSMKKVSVYLTILLIIMCLLIHFSNFTLKEVISSFVSLGIAITVYQQWLANRHEISIDKYYDRLENANKRMEVFDNVEKATLHVFAELDKLEYVIMKYELGYLSPKIAWRGIENFHSLCRTREGFSALAKEWVFIATYLKTTRALVLNICNNSVLVVSNGDTK